MLDAFRLQRVISIFQVHNLREWHSDISLRLLGAELDMSCGAAERTLNPPPEKPRNAQVKSTIFCKA